MRSQLQDPEVRAQGVARLHLRLQADPLQLLLPARAAAPQRRARHRARSSASRPRASSRPTGACTRSTASSGRPASGPTTSCSRWRSRARRAQPARSLGAGRARPPRHDACPGFPNMFLMYGPNTNTSGGSIIVYLEAQAAYIRQALQRCATRGAGAIEVRARGRGGQRPCAAGALRRDGVDASATPGTATSTGGSSPTGPATCASTCSRPSARRGRVPLRAAARARGGLKDAERRTRVRLRDRRAPARPAACSPTGSPRTPRCGCCCSRPAAGTAR